jgi:chaperonin GroES
MADEPQDETELQPGEPDQGVSPPAAPLQSPQGTDFEDKHLATHKKLMEWEKSINIAKDLDDELLGEIAQKVIREYDLDYNSCSDWREKSKKSMDLAMQVAEAKSYPWPRASNVIYPLMTNAAIQFAARAYPAIVSGKEVVRGTTVGSDDGVPMIGPQGPVINPQTGQPAYQVPPGAKKERAQRIGEHMSWQLLDEQPEWEEETDKLLHILPIAGCVFRKSYFDSANGRNASIMVPAPQLVINYWAKSVETAMRLTEEIRLYPIEITENERAETFLEINYPVASSDSQKDDKRPVDSSDDDAPHIFLEQHRWLDLDKDGYPEPYIVTVHKSMAKVVRIVARYDSEGVHINKQSGEITKIDPIHYYTKYDFLPNPDGGIYGVGFGQLLRPINEAINTTLNMMIDAGHLQVVGGGFIGKGLSMHTGAVRFTPGEYKTVNVAGTTVRENIVPLETPGPNTVLFQLLGMLTEAGKEIASVKDILTGEASQANVPATTTLALIEQGLKTFTAIYKRVHRALKKELDKLYRLNRIYLPAISGYSKNNEWKNITQQDYAQGSGVEPLSDPSMVSDMQKLGRAQFLLQFAGNPHFNPVAIYQRVLAAASIEKPEELLVTQLPPNPEVIEKAAKLEATHERVAAEASKDYAQAILFLTQAAKVSGDAHLAWINQQLEIFKAHLEGVSNGSESGPAQGSNPAGLPPVPAPPSVNSPTPFSGGLSGAGQGGGLGALGGGPPGAG